MKFYIYFIFIFIFILDPSAFVHIQYYTIQIVIVRMLN